jgi:hypothetical protein
MSPRRCIERPVVNVAMEEEMRQLHVRLDSMETTQIREPKFGDVNESKSEYVEEEEFVGEQVVEDQLLRVVVKMGTKEKMEVPMCKVLELIHTHLGFPFPKFFPCLLFIIQCSIF